MRKGDLGHGDEVVLRIHIRPGDRDFWRCTPEERLNRQRFVKARVLTIPRNGRAVDVEYETNVYDTPTQQWILGTRTATVDSRSLVRTWAEQERLVAEKQETENRKVLQQAYKVMLEERELIEKGEIVEQTVLLLESLGIGARIFGGRYVSGVGRTVPSGLQVTDIQKLRDLLLTVTLT